MVLKSTRFSPEQMLEQLETIRDLSPACAPLHQNGPLLEQLVCRDIELEGLMPWSSNYTFLARLTAKDDEPLLAIYKPGDGERPLWDFPDGTLSQREFASYLVSQLLGWPKIPPTVLRSGPHGLGSVQLFIEAEYEAHYFNMRDVPTFTGDFRDMALFDFIVNNADRKGGHCLKGRDGQIWAIDHGLTFHPAPKLRTVIWEFTDSPIPESRLADLSRLVNLLDDSRLRGVLLNLITERELDAFQQRTAALAERRQFPPLRSGRNMPYPPI
ncbi:MAG: SCO1664 family protein [Anaerolineae bacterium]